MLARQVESGGWRHNVDGARSRVSLKGRKDKMNPTVSRARECKTASQ